MLEFIFLLPLATGLTSLALPATLGRILLLVTALLHLQLTVMSWIDILCRVLARSILSDSGGVVAFAGEWLQPRRDEAVASGQAPKDTPELLRAELDALRAR